MVSAAVACLPTAVSLLLLEALFMQVSEVSLTLTWPCRLCLLIVLLCASHCYKLSPFQAHCGRWHCTHFLRPACLFTAHVGSGSSPFSCGVFLPLPLLQGFPLLITGQCCCLCQLSCLFTDHMGGGSSLLSCGNFLPPWLLQAFVLLVVGHRQLLLARPSLFIHSSGKHSLSPSLVLSAPHHLSHVSLLFLLRITVSLFSPGGGRSLQGVMLSGPGLSVGVPWYC
jgi:hypothetical protein